MHAFSPCYVRQVIKPEMETEMKRNEKALIYIIATVALAHSAMGGLVGCMAGSIDAGHG